MVNYTYNAWGEIISTSGTMADTIGQVNKLRYRSYYYDSETGFYYLQSRYYDPVVKRFISPDSCLGVNEDIHTYNLYIYCGNNPIINADYSGQVTIKVAGIALAVTYACVTVAKSAYNYIKNGSYSFARGKYIDSQSSGNASKMRMGFGKGDYNGCGWIATFNALVMVGDYVHPKKIIQAYELTYGAVLMGAFGVNPLHIMAYLRLRGYSVSVTSDKSKMTEIAKCNAANILLYIKSNGKAHYVAFDWNGSVFVTHNPYTNTYKSISSFISDKGGVIAIMISI